MKIEQNVTSVTIPSGSYQVHIGIEHLYSHPMHHHFTSPSINLPFTVNVGTVSYAIYENDILEFNLTTSESTTISMDQSSNKNSFITVAYEEII